ncbi:MAG: peptidoglycan-binding protein [Deltaproteobacteria bacterium]|nr:peptidoglycan-binding protein [Deltaproteobacteria bacterium]
MAFQLSVNKKPQLAELDLDTRLERIRHNKEFISSKSSGEKVSWLQEELNRLSRSRGEEGKVLEVNGKFDAATAKAVKEFQTSYGIDDQGQLVNGGGLRVDGIVGPRTMRALDLAAGRNTLSAEEYFKTIKKPYVAKKEIVEMPKVEAPEEQLVKAEVKPLPIEKDLELLNTNVCVALPPVVAAKDVSPEKLQAVLDEKCKGPCPLAAQTIIDLCIDHGFDISLFLGQALQESHIGTAAGRPLRTKNIFNVGNVDSGANRYMDSWEAGAENYLKLMSRAYGKTAEDVIKSDFKRTDTGDHYASDPSYSAKIAAHVSFFRNKLNS